eukprot:m.737127 g.737127  ORF g.737127 m.737127 type:complete len:57 (-) comp23098_c1_seq8:1319-1489(-)
MFLNVVYRSMKMDPSIKRQKAFAKRLLQVCAAYSRPALLCGVLSHRVPHICHVNTC